MSIKVFTLTALAVAINGQLNPNPAGPKIKTIGGGVVVEGTGLTVETPDAVVDVVANINTNTAGLDAVSSMLGITRRQSPAPDDSASLPELVGTLIERMEALHNVTVAGNMARNMAQVWGTAPAEVSAQGGETVFIGGSNFITGLPGAYVATWTYTSEDGQTRTQVESAPTTATSATLLAVTAPAWPHPPARTEYVADLVVTQQGLPLPYMGADTVYTTFEADHPTMTDFSETEVLLAPSDVSNGSGEFTLQVDDVDGEVSGIVVTGTSSNASFITRVIAVGNTTTNERTMEVFFAAGDNTCGEANVTLVVTDNLGLTINQTFVVGISCDAVFTPIVRTGNSRSDTSFGRGPQQMRITTDNGANNGAFEAFRTFTGTRYVKITKLSGRHQGEHATFRLVSALSRSMRDTILSCGTTTAYTNSASTTRWTSRYSGTKVDGALPLYDTNNQQRALRYMFICGINTSSDDDRSILAFTYYTGRGNNWGDSWRGSYQQGTAWSLYNDDYKMGQYGRGWSSIQAYPGYKAGSNNAGGYEISVSDSDTL